MSLQQFLREEAAKQRTPEARREREEWVDSVTRLVDQMRDWIREADTEGVLDVGEVAHHVGEETLGSYDIPGLEIALGRRRVQVVPVARRIVGPIWGPEGISVVRPEGRVDLLGAGDRFILYRFRDERGQEIWKIIEDGGVVFGPFDRRTFESAIERLLS